MGEQFLISQFHFSGHLMRSLKNQLKTKNMIRYVSKIKVEMEVVKLSPNNEYQCVIESYDECISAHTKNISLNCTLPFEEELSKEKPICRTYGEGRQVIRKLLSLKQICIEACLQINIQYKEYTDNYLLTLARPKVVETFTEQSSIKFAYIYEIPKNVRLLTNTHEYTVPVALGYFGSIAGIFTGVSILGILGYFIDTKWVINTIKKYCMIGFVLGMCIYLAIIFVVLLDKFFEGPVETSINFESFDSDISISICSQTYVYNLQELQQVNQALVAIESFSLKQMSFWKKWMNISTTLRSISLDEGPHKIDMLSDVTLKTAQFFVLPVNNFTISVCNTFDLNNYTHISSINLEYNREIEIYFHKKGQFLLEWRNKKNRLLAASPDNVKLSNAQVEITDFAALIGIEHKTSIDSPENDTFDECMITHGKQSLGYDLMQCFFTRNITDLCLNIANDNSFEKVHNLIHSATPCKPPNMVLSTKAIKSNYLTNIKLKREINSLNKEIDFGMASRRPKIVIVFASFAKMSKV